MTQIRHLLSLIRSHVDGDDRRFLSVAEHIAHDARAAGKAKVADSIMREVEDGRKKGTEPLALSPELDKLVYVSRPSRGLDGVVLDGNLERDLRRLLREQELRDELEDMDLKPRRKIMLAGPSGTGKTMTAAALAAEMGLPLFTIGLDGVITRYMGETASKLRLVFDAMEKHMGVWFFDEFDALASTRDTQNDIGEARRILNSLLMLIEANTSGGFIVAATNALHRLDHAIYRRFDLILSYDRVNGEQGREVSQRRLHRFMLDHIDWSDLVPLFEGLSHGEIDLAVTEAARIAVLDNGGKLSKDDLVEELQRRRKTAPGVKGPVAYAGAEA